MYKALSTNSNIQHYCDLKTQSRLLFLHLVKNGQFCNNCVFSRNLFCLWKRSISRMSAQSATLYDNSFHSATKMAPLEHCPCKMRSLIPLYSQYWTINTVSSPVFSFLITSSYQTSTFNEYHFNKSQLQTVVLNPLKQNDILASQQLSL